MMQEEFVATNEDVEKADGFLFKKPLFEATLENTLKSRLEELQTRLNEAVAREGEASRQLVLSRAREAVASQLLENAVQDAQDADRRAASAEERVRSLEEKCTLPSSLPIWTAQAVSEQLLESAVLEAQEAGRRAAHAEEKLRLMENIAAEKLAEKEALEAVMERCVKEMNCFLDTDSQQCLALNKSLLPEAIRQTAARMGEMELLLNESENECDTLTKKLAEQSEVVSKLREIAKKGEEQNNELKACLVAFPTLSKALIDLEVHCKALAEENQALRTMCAETTDQMAHVKAYVDARAAIVKQRTEALDNVPTEDLYTEYLSKSIKTEKTKIALLLSTLVAKVRLLTSEVFHVKQRNLGLIRVITEDAKDDPDRKREIEYLSACLAFKDAVDTNARWAGQPAHPMEERPILSSGSAEKIILDAIGHPDGIKQKAPKDQMDLADRFNRLSAQHEHTRSMLERGKAMIDTLCAKVVAKDNELTRAMVRISKLEKQQSMTPSERSAIMQAASASVAVSENCKHCVALLGLNRELIDYQNMEEARSADAANQRAVQQKEHEQKMADLKLAHRNELAEANLKRRDAESAATLRMSEMKQEIKDLKEGIVRERTRTDARIARQSPNLPHDSGRQHQEQPPPRQQGQEVACTVARQIALSVLHPTWRQMEHSRQEAAELSRRLLEGEGNAEIIEAVLSTPMLNGDRRETLGAYVIRIVKQCISANTAFSKQAEREQIDSDRLIKELVSDFKKALDGIIAKLNGGAECPDVSALRALITQHEGSAQHVTALEMAFNVCAAYVESMSTSLLQQQQHQNQQNQQQNQQNQPQGTGQYHGDERQVSDAGKRGSAGNLPHGRKKLHRSTPADDAE